MQAEDDDCFDDAAAEKLPFQVRIVHSIAIDVTKHHIGTHFNISEAELTRLAPASDPTSLQFWSMLSMPAISPLASVRSTPRSTEKSLLPKAEISDARQFYCHPWPFV